MPSVLKSLNASNTVRKIICQTKELKAMQKTCLICGEKFERQHNNQKYCSLKCAHIASIQLERKYQSKKRKRKAPKLCTVQCKMCGKTFETSRYNKIYCSDECYQKSLRIRSRQQTKLKQEKRTVTCPVCGETFETTDSRGKYCSAECRLKHYALAFKVRTHIAKCPVCGKSFETNTSRKYCSFECSHEAKMEHYRRWKEKNNLTKVDAEVEKKVKPTKRSTLDNLVSQADMCGLSYGMYTAQLRLGKTFEELHAAHLKELASAE